MESDDDTETDTTQQQQPGSEETPPKEAPEKTPPAGDEAPYFVANSKDELDQRLTSERTAAQLAMAKEYGFDDVESFQAHLTSVREKADAEKSEADRLREENTNRKKNETTLAKENRQLKVSQAARDVATELEVNPKKVSDVMKLAGVDEIPLQSDGSVDTNAIKKAMNDVLKRNPFFRGSAGGGPSIGGGGNPADAAANALTLEQKIQKAQSEGRIMDVISLQMQKMRNG